MYYLRSRYYGAEWSRFLNSDLFLGDLVQLISQNSYCYCSNNAVINVDYDGLKSSPTRMPASFVVAQAKKMYEENWEYVGGEKSYGEVDCIGVILYCVLEYYGKWNKDYYLTIQGEKISIGQGTNSAISRQIAGGKKQLKQNVIPSDKNLLAHTLKPGMVIYRDDFGHVGVYVGYYVDLDGTVYQHAVIHAANSKEDMKVCEIWDAESDFMYYCEYNYIEYDMTYNDTLPPLEKPGCPFKMVCLE